MLDLNLTREGGTTRYWLNSCRDKVRNRQDSGETPMIALPQIGFFVNAHGDARIDRHVISGYDGGFNEAHATVPGAFSTEIESQTVTCATPQRRSRGRSPGYAVASLQPRAGKWASPRKGRRSNFRNATVSQVRQRLVFRFGQ